MVEMEIENRTVEQVAGFLVEASDRDIQPGRGSTGTRWSDGSRNGARTEVGG
jgi:hypothetical protein